MTSHHIIADGLCRVACILHAVVQKYCTEHISEYFWFFKSAAGVPRAGRWCPSGKPLVAERHRTPSLAQGCQYPGGQHTTQDPDTQKPWPERSRPPASRPGARPRASSSPPRPPASPCRRREASRSRTASARAPGPSWRSGGTSLKKSAKEFRL